MRVVVVGRMKNHQFRSKLAPLLALKGVDSLDLVRRFPLNQPGVSEHCPPRWMRRILPLAEAYRLATLFRLCLRKSRPDCLIGVHLYPHGIYVWLAGRLLRIKAIQLLVGKDLHRAVGNRLLLRMVRDAQMVGVRGKNSARRLTAKGIPAERIFTPPNAFDVMPYTVPDAESKQFDLISVGEFIERKQHSLLLRAVQRLRSRYPGIRLALVGDGALRKRLVKLSAALGIEDNVVFLGQVAPGDVPGYLGKARAFVMASKGEGLPMAMVEALAAGLPVVAPDVGDITTVARHGFNALVVQRRTPERFAEAIGGLLSDPDLYNRLREGAMQSREWFRVHYSLDAAAEVWAKALNVEGNAVTRTLLQSRAT